MTGGAIDPTDPGSELVERRRTVVTALPLKRRARERLADLLDARVADVREPIERPDLVLAPPCSPQLIGALSNKYDGADVIVVELDDWDFDIELGGPVKRILRSGASGYLLADSIDELAAKLSNGGDSARSEPNPVELEAASYVDDLVAAFLDQSDLAAVEVERDGESR